MYNEFNMTYAEKEKEVEHMPGRNGTGPMGTGPMTGRALGPCAGGGAWKYGAGLGLGLGLGLACRRGFCRGLGYGLFQNQTSPETRKQLLQQRKDALKDRLEAVERQLEDL